MERPSAEAPRPAVRHAALPLPAAEAGLLLPLEHARAALEQIVPPASALFRRRPLRPSIDRLSAVGRPWMGSPDALAALAAADTGVLDDASHAALFGPPDVGEWLRKRADGSARDDHPYSAPLDATAIVRAAIGEGDDDLLWLHDRMHAFHYAVMNGIRAAADSPTTRDPDDVISGKRRLQQLLASPALMRLFGFACDIHLDFDAELPQARAAGHITDIDVTG